MLAAEHWRENGAAIVGERVFIMFLLVMGGLFAWNVERALRTGVLKGRGLDIARDARPGAFKVQLWGNVVIGAALWLGALTLSVLRFI